MSQMTHIGHPPSLAAANTTREAILPPKCNFSEPQASSSRLVEQQMIENGILTTEDINLQVFGSSEPNLGSNFHSPETLHATINYYNAYNSFTAAERKLERTIEQIQREQIDLYQDPTNSIDNFFNENINVDADQPIETDKIDQDTGLKFSSHELTKDDPDPFEPGGKLLSLDGRSDLSTQPPHLLTTYSLLQMPRESLPCEAAEIMLKTTTEEHGTVAALAALSKELDEAHTDAGVINAFSPRRHFMTMSSETYQLLA
ncbi:hypothetical protein SERLADRAFT_434095 [Serpula lacrymans var. lacrymans S7.9]|uniref:Uncharacterized protein n=1 Tax=Serpula lacrymans var. lacrymans (strain S7.9) TaxID=578457 RepID=F8NLP1_SERL9|nr:uncharacterized protein SERLADRAFT_434095 [Serpula lacrymans var. lacrymans S7.9]EGO28222.1 hypothetical protein SERLADRAFT_434095 [Serpula lacrymans var. lacrymans S7.9]